MQQIAGPAQDERWLDEVDTTLPARHRAGPPDVPHAQRGAPPAGTCAEAPAGAGGYHPPRWTSAIDRGERRAIAAISGIADLETLRLPPGRGVVFRYAIPLLQALPALRNGLLSVLRARLGGQRRP
jgi:hypothetical protein